MARDPKIIRPGDLVKVVKADVFLRCGYAIDIKELADKISQEDKFYINSVVRQIAGRQFPGKPYNGAHDPIIHLDIAVGVAKVLARWQGFGGNERKVYSHYMPFCEGKEYRVNSKRCVQSGTRSPPYGGSYGEDEPEQGYLADAKTHIILLMWDDQHGEFEIEAANVEKVHAVQANEMPARIHSTRRG